MLSAVTLHRDVSWTCPNLSYCPSFLFDVPYKSSILFHPGQYNRNLTVNFIPNKLNSTLKLIFTKVGVPMWSSSIFEEVTTETGDTKEWVREGMWAPWAPWEWIYKEKSPVSPKNQRCCKASVQQVYRVFCLASCAVFKNHTFLKRDKRGEQTNFRALQTSLVQGWHRPGFQPGAFFNDQVI